MESFDSTTGYCCDKNSTSDYCTSTRYMCTDRALTPAMKYNFCPFSQSYCSNSPQQELKDNTVHSEATTYMFGRDNVCTWRIKVGSDYQFMKKI